MNEHLETFYQSMGNMINYVNEEKTKTETDYAVLLKKFKKLETEFDRYKSVSLIKKLDKELFEKTNEIMFLKKKIDKFETKNKKEIKEEDIEVEVEVELITIGKEEYYITQDIHKDIYQKLEDNSVGTIIGKYINNKLVYIRRQQPVQPS